MSLWEYKVITSGKGGFATPALLEKFLNDLGRDEWEIIHFQTPPENFLAFTGLARRSTQRDWTLEDAAAAAAKAEAEKLRAEFEAKFKAANQHGGGSAEERAPSLIEEKVSPDDGFRKPVDTSHDDEPEAAEDEKDEWDKLTAAEEDELPTFFEAIKPHMRRNQRGPGMSVGVDYLAKKWDQNEEDLKGALVECGFVVPADEDTKPEYLEYDGDLFWLNINRRGELWINTKEKPRPVFRPVKAQKIAIEEEQKPQPAAAAKPEAEKPENGHRAAEGQEAPGAEAAKPEAPAPREGKHERPAVALPEGPALLAKIRPHMRRNRRGPGGSGSTSFLSRALRTNETDLRAAFAALGLTLPATDKDKPVYTEIANELWWLNLDSRGGLWINGREKKQGETAAAANAAAVEQPAPAESTPGAAAPDAVPSPEVAPSIEGAAPAQSAASPAASSGAEGAVASAPAGETAPAAETTDAGGKSQGAATNVDDSERAREVAPMPAEASSSTVGGNAEPAASAGGALLSAVRPVLKETRTGAIAAKAERVAEELGKPVDGLISALVDAGLKIPEKPREKPVFVEHGGEIFWLNKNAKGELWLNAKASKFADKEESDDDADAEGGTESGEATASASEGGEGDAEKKPRRAGRSRSKKTE